jgi:hypothetical protein
MRSLRASVLFLAAMALAQAGCSDPCRDLGDRICDCQPEGSVRTACKNDVKIRINAAKPSGDDDNFCSAKLDTCPDPGSAVGVCDLLNTCQGKVNCGLALPPPGGCEVATP